jgi:hypothetical protein
MIREIVYFFCEHIARIIFAKKVNKRKRIIHGNPGLAVQGYIPWKN